jgi:hypothetical protein
MAHIAPGLPIAERAPQPVVDERATPKKASAVRVENMRAIPDFMTEPS